MPRLYINVSILIMYKFESQDSAFQSNPEMNLPQITNEDTFHRRNAMRYGASDHDNTLNGKEIAAGFGGILWVLLSSHFPFCQISNEK